MVMMVCSDDVVFCCDDLISLWIASLNEKNDKSIEMESEKC